MAENTNISWADYTHNHWIGCTRISPACDGCYAAHLMDTRFGRASWGGPGAGTGTRDLTSEANRRKPFGWDRAAAAAGRRPFVFCSSLADVFDNVVPVEWRQDLFELIRATPNLVWLLLSKRPQNMVKMADAAGGLPSNAALGTTVEDQPRADVNLPALKIAKIELAPIFTFGSFEPLISSVVVDPMMMPDWVITGGETDQGAHKARPTHPDWFRELRDQCAATGVPFHFKQWGEWVPQVGAVDGWTIPDDPEISRIDHRDWEEDRWGDPYRPMWCDEIDDDTVSRVGKRHAGRKLDGVVHDAFPAIERRPA